MQEKKNHSFPEMLKDAALVGFIAAALALPLVGFKTVDRATQMDLEFRFGEMFYAVAVISVARLLLNLTGTCLAPPPFPATTSLIFLFLLDYPLQLLPIAYPPLASLTFF